ncbi:MAG: hypothetical protein ABI696_18125, partial [Rubrivivax sp.]
MHATQFVVVHTPGPAWKPGIPAFEQDGLQLHVAHYAQLLKEGKLVMGGPFLDAKSGGIMMAEPGVPPSFRRGRPSGEVRASHL